MTARDVLQAIRERAERNTVAGGTTWGLMTLARDEVPKLLAALTAALELHKLIVYRDPRNEPDDSGDGYYGTARYCEHCGDTSGGYPCPTVRAISEALGAAPEVRGA